MSRLLSNELNGREVFMFKNKFHVTKIIKLTIRSEYCAFNVVHTQILPSVKQCERWIRRSVPRFPNSKILHLYRPSSLLLRSSATLQNADGHPNLSYVNYGPRFKSFSLRDWNKEELNRRSSNTMYRRITIRNFNRRTWLLLSNLLLIIRQDIYMRTKGYAGK